MRGRIPLHSRPLVRVCLVDDPEGFARALFIEALRREGVSVTASGLRRPMVSLPEKDAYAGLTRVAVYESPPLSELLKVTLKVSHNLYASTLPLLLAVREGEKTLPAGMTAESKALAGLGLNTKSIALESGAGGGTCDRLSPRATVALVLAMMKRSDYPAFRAGLPVLGVDGTLVDAVSKSSPARGKVRAKTGTYIDTDLVNDRLFLRSKSLAGEMTTRAGRTLAFAMFVNDVPLPPGVDGSREGKVLGRLCEILYERTP
jgi:D-alanyl-D-alanine carboxypeptidase/D-alanyl-D-alanine-endopeptidase (penicillin-binding protein 4)